MYNNQNADNIYFTNNTDGKNLTQAFNMLTTTLENKVDKIEGSRLITAEEVKKLEALSFNENGAIEVPITINAANVQNLYDVISNIVTGEGTNIYDNEEKQLFNIDLGAEVNKINEVSSEFNITDSRVLELKTIPTEKVIGLNNLISKVDSLDMILNGSDNSTKGLVEVVDNLSYQLNNYITIDDFQKVIGNLEDMKINNINITADIAEIKNQLSWQEL